MLKKILNEKYLIEAFINCGLIYKMKRKRFDNGSVWCMKKILGNERILSGKGFEEIQSCGLSQIIKFKLQVFKLINNLNTKITK